MDTDGRARSAELAADLSLWLSTHRNELAPRGSMKSRLVPDVLASDSVPLLHSESLSSDKRVLLHGGDLALEIVQLTNACGPLR